MNSAPSHDIFVSYNREDQGVALRFVKAFQREGLSVWWDTTLRSGEAYDEVTEAALRNARAVVVLWSTRSVVSRWVRAEATLAQRNQTLAPVMIEQCDRPIMFELVQTPDLSHWSGEPADLVWLGYLADIRRRVAHDDPQAIPTNLPRQLAPIIGRESAIAEIEGLLIEHPGVMLVGTGGVGKTRLSLEVGRRLSSLEEQDARAGYLRRKVSAGVWFVQLATLSDPALIPATVAAALDIALPDGAAPEQALARRLGQANLLILLDNCEHLLQAAAEFCEYLLERCPGVRLLASSQEPLRIHGEAVFQVPPLTLPGPDEVGSGQALESPSVMLFIARARAADSRFKLREADAAHVATICRRLDGLPLAIEMAAARVTTLGLQALVASLDERFAILTEGRRTALPRHQTLRATLEWSYGLLDARQQSGLRGMGVFPADFTLMAACAVSVPDEADKASAPDVVVHLAARSLIFPDVSDVATYYHMMETTREYARAKLGEAQEGFQVSRRHANFIRERMDKCYEESFVVSDAALRSAYGRDLENLRTAVEWSFGAGNDIITGFSLLGASEPLFLVLNRIAECRMRIEAALLRLAELEPGPLHARVCESLGRAYGFSNPAKAFEWLSNALPARRGGDPAALGALLVYMGRIAQVIAGKYDLSEQLLDEGAPLVERSGLPRVRGHLYRGMANRFAKHGDFEASVAMMRRSHEAFIEGGAISAANAARTSLGYMLWASGDVDAAIANGREVLAGIRSFTFPDDSLLGFALGNLAGMLTARGDLSEAGASLIEALPKLAEPWQIWVIFDHVALLAARSGEADLAARSLGFAESSYLSHGAMRQPNEQRARDAALLQVERALDPAQVAALQAEGAGLPRKAAIDMAARIGELASRLSGKNSS